MQTEVDVFIIGGGINGAAIAADAAGRGLSVVLCEKNDLASGTSSASSKLIHGGLRYLETYEFGLVHQALRERAILLNRAPQLVVPLEFVLPYESHLRPAWLIRLGLLFYDCLASHKNMPRSKSILFKDDLRGKALLPNLTKGFSYFDCFTDDARLVILNALAAKEQGAQILTHTEFVSALKGQTGWKIQLKNTMTGGLLNYTAKALVNVAGPWVKEVERHISPGLSFNVELIKGSHIIVPQLYSGNFAYILQNKDQRIVFTIPFYKQFTLIGTTDVRYEGPLDNTTISELEIHYLCDLIKLYFKKPIQQKDIIASYAGVRCLKASTKGPSKISREYKLLLDAKDPVPHLTVIGGKLTTHRRLAEDAVNQLRPFFKAMGPSTTATKSLPGGDVPQQNIAKFKSELKNQFPWLPAELVDSYTSRYGTRVYLLLDEASSLNDLGRDFGHGLYQKEVEFLIREEWALSPDDILWRRTKLGLFFSDAEKQTLLYNMPHNLA